MRSTPKQFHPGDCEQDSFDITSSWSFFSSGQEAQVVADRLASGDFLLGCEDEFPAPTANSHTTSGTFGDGSDPADPSINSAPDVISLATLDEISLGARANLAAAYGFDPDWFDAVEVGDQSYLVAHHVIGSGSPTPGKVLIVGTDRRGLTYGVIDFLKSLDRVEFGAANWWAPQNWQNGATCTDYTDPDFLCTGAPNATCWNSSAAPATARSWDAATLARWCPAHVLNHPDVPFRGAWPTYEAGSFLDEVLDVPLGLDCTPTSDEYSWFDKRVEFCDRQGWATDLEDRCHDARVRLDAMVWGKYTHAWSDSSPIWRSQRFREETTDEDTGGPDGCDPGIVYSELYQYLDERGVSLMPTAYGLEVRNPEGPVEGELVTPGQYRGER